MPEWRTPELWPVWWAATDRSFSTTVTVEPGRAASTARAVARPTMPPPMTTTSGVTDSHASEVRLAPSRLGHQAGVELLVRRGAGAADEGVVREAGTAPAGP